MSRLCPSNRTISVALLALLSTFGCSAGENGESTEAHSGGSSTVSNSGEVDTSGGSNFGGTSSGGAFPSGGASSSGGEQSAGGTGSGAGGETSTGPLPTADAQLLEDVLPRLNTLADRTLDWWMTYGKDDTNGGFYGTLNDMGASVSSTDKGLIQQSRHLWSLSMWYERRAATNEIKLAADDTYAFITDNMLDADDLFFFKVNQTGSVVDNKKKIYAQAFAIYGLSTYGRVFGVSQAVDHALDCFNALDATYHDAENGGYDQTSDPDSWIGGAARGTNTHIHLMEAFTALAEATDNATVGARLNEFIDLTANELLQPSGYVHQSFDDMWTPQGSPLVSYGHDLETSWLLMDAAQVMGRTGESALTDAARIMALTSAVEGYDEMNGGYYDGGVPGGSVTASEKIWWAQFEALAGLWTLYDLTGDIAHLEKLERTLEWIEATEALPNGEWYWGHDSNGSIGGRGTNKGEEWKTSYHNLRALVFTADWIESALE